MPRKRRTRHGQAPLTANGARAAGGDRRRAALVAGARQHGKWNAVMVEVGRSADLASHHLRAIARRTGGAATVRSREVNGDLPPCKIKAGRKNLVIATAPHSLVFPVISYDIIHLAHAFFRPTAHVP